MGARIGHIAIFSENPSNLAKFYGEVFGIKVTGVDDLGNAWVTDGYMDIALLRRRSPSAPKAGINHFGFTIDPAERPALLAKMKKYGIEPYSPYVDAPEAHRPYAEDAVKDPMGNRFDVSTGMKDVRGGTGATTLAQGQHPVIRHIALFSDDTEKLAQFYGECFGMKRTGESKGDPALLNPELLLLMAASSCQMLWFLDVASKARLDVVEYRDDALALMPLDEEPVRVTEIELRPHIVVGGQVSVERVRKLVDTAHRHCFISNSLSSKVTINPTVEVRT